MTLRDYWRQHWFLTLLVVLLLLGLILGASSAGPSVQRVTDYIDPRITTGIVLFLMSITLDTGRLAAAIRSPAAVLVAAATCYVVIPLMGWGMSFLQLTPDFRIGLIIAACVPSTTAASSVLTRKARGNDAVALLNTVITNGACFLLTPAWLFATTLQSVQLDTRKLMFDLVAAVLLPSVVAQVLRQDRAIREAADHYKPYVSNVAQSIIELIVFSAAIRCGGVLRGLDSSGQTTQWSLLLGVGVLWGCVAGLHLLGMIGGWGLARVFKLSSGDRTAVIFGGSQKTLPIGLYIAGSPDLFGAAYPFALLPILLYHASQLFIDSWLADRWGNEPRPRVSPN
jgi:sodium/bile acid cotransporter 7